MNRFALIVLAGLTLLLTGCEDLWDECPETREEIDIPGAAWRGITNVACSCPDERMQDKTDICCAKKGGVCEGEDIPPPTQTTSPSSGPRFGIHGFQVGGAGLTIPAECEPISAEWEYWNLQDTLLLSSTELFGDGVYPIFRVYGPFHESGGSKDAEFLMVEAPAGFNPIPAGSLQEIIIPFSGQQEGSYEAVLEQIPRDTPGKRDASFLVIGEDDGDDYIWDSAFGECCDTNDELCF